MGVKVTKMFFIFSFLILCACKDDVSDNKKPGHYGFAFLTEKKELVNYQIIDKQCVFIVITSSKLTNSLEKGDTRETSDGYTNFKYSSSMKEGNLSWICNLKKDDVNKGTMKINNQEYSLEGGNVFYVFFNKENIESRQIGKYSKEPTKDSIETYRGKIEKSREHTER